MRKRKFYFFKPKVPSRDLGMYPISNEIQILLNGGGSKDFKLQILDTTVLFL